MGPAVHACSTTDAGELRAREGLVSALDRASNDLDDRNLSFLLVLQPSSECYRGNHTPASCFSTFFSIITALQNREDMGFFMAFCRYRLQC